jgi:hypothetical protein
MLTYLAAPLSCSRCNSNHGPRLNSAALYKEFYYYLRFIHQLNFYVLIYLGSMSKKLISLIKTYKFYRVLVYLFNDFNGSKLGI